MKPMLDYLTRDEGDAEGDDPIAQATAAVEELRSANEAAATAAEEARTRHAEETRALTTRLQSIETRLNRPGARTEQRNEDDNLPTRAFLNFCRRGVERIPEVEVRALQTSPDEAGGYLIPEQFLPEIQRNLVLFSPIRQAARVANASVGEVILPKRTGTLTAQWVEETEDRPATQPAYGQQKITIYELACYVDVSNRLLEDSAFNLEAELSRDFGEEFGRAEGAAFINGDGVGKPTGLLQNTDIEQLDLAGAAITADELIDLYHGLPSFYAANATWAMNRTTIGAIRKLKDSSGMYLWNDQITAGNPPTILGRPVVEMPDMPDVGGTEPAVVFGDFSQGFRIFDRVALSVLRDPYTMQTKGQVRFHARRRVGGAVTKPEALKFLGTAA